MIKKIILITLFVCTDGLLCFAQKIEGQSLSWEKIKAKARAENKYIFMDCYATWCGPCKWMDKYILSDTSVVRYLDEHFILIKVQFDKTPQDNEYVKNWYNDAEQIAREMLINAYPTYLFYLPNGEPAHRFEGIVKKPSEFIRKLSESLRKDKQVYTILKQLYKQPADSAILHEAIEAAQTAKHPIIADSLAGVYIGTLKQPLSKENIDFIFYNIRSSKYPTFPWMMSNISAINLGLNREEFAEKQISYIIRTEIIDSVIKKNCKKISWEFVRKIIIKKHPKLPDSLWRFLRLGFENGIIKYEISEKYTDKLLSPDWKSLEKYLTKRYRGQDIHAIILKNKPSHYRKIKDWNAAGRSIIEYLLAFSVDDYTANDLIWKYVFLYADDNNVLQSALPISKKIVDNNPNEANYMDTYANLLYKLGRINLALQWEENALKLSRSLPKPNEGNVRLFEEVLQKMKVNAKTWNN
jgi:thiol-disulfide isomerase/thioredoxin